MKVLLEHAHTYPAILSPASMCFAYPSRVADAWEPFVEKIIEDESDVPATTLSLAISSGSSRELCLRDWMPRRSLLRRMQRLRKPIDLGHLLFDARSAIDLGNVTHFLRGPLTAILYSRSALDNHDLAGHDLHVVLPTRSPGFVCQMFALLDIPFISTDREVRGSLISVHKSDSATGSRVQHYPIPSLFTNAVLRNEPDTPKRVFIARKGARRIINEAEVEAIVEKDGFVKCYFEELSVREQWRIMSNAEEIVAIHGAALGNLLVHHGWQTGEGPKVVEIFGAGHKVKCFRYYVAALNGRWCSVRSQITSKIIRDMDENFKSHSHAFDPIMVHPESVRLALEYVRQM